MDYTRVLNPGTPPPAGFTLDDPTDWDYFTEGANNILYRYCGGHPYFKPFLLRLRKYLPGAPTTKQLHSHINQRFAPLFGHYVMRTDLIGLGDGLIADFNERLKEEEETGEVRDWAGRPVQKKKRRLLDAEEKFGLLVEDMSCGNYLFPKDEEEDGDDNEDGGDKKMTDDEEDVDPDDPGSQWRDMATIEFKPKWLSQSPNAPSTWTLCRTCAVRLMSGQRHVANNPVPVEYCPLDLASGDKERIETAVYSIVNSGHNVMIADPKPDEDESDAESDVSMKDREAEEGGSPDDDLSHALAKTLEGSLVTLLTFFFRDSPIIPLLTKLQHQFGTRGVFTSATLALMSESDKLPSEDELVKNAEMQGTQEENDIWTAMTLRDCSLFLKIWVRRREGRRMEARVECKVGDLDLKTGEGGRAVYWRDVERRLRQGGWYLGKGTGRNCRTGEGVV